jgi:hypothetical protein
VVWRHVQITRRPIAHFQKSWHVLIMFYFSNSSTSFF